MSFELKELIIEIEGMTCTSCEMRLERAINKISGITKVKVSYEKSKASITFEADKVTKEAIFECIEKAGYKVKGTVNGKASNKAFSLGKNNTESFNINQLLGIGIIVLALYLIIKNTIGFNFIPEINQSMGYSILFIVGALTSLHCIAMCGGINLSQCVTYKAQDKNAMEKFKPSFLYNMGRVVSYTLVGGIAGGLGSVVSFSGYAKGMVAVISGILMIVMGINLLNIFPWLRSFNIRMPKIFANTIFKSGKSYGPFYVGLLNGLMPCGPLQTMQLYALGTGSVLAGAMSMLMFSLGTVPLMFGFGALSTLLSKRFTNKLMKVSAVLIIILGIVMLNRGLSLSGVSTAVAASSKAGNIAVIQGDYQEVTIDLMPGKYAPIVVQKGIPVRFNIKAAKENLNGCNNAVIIPRLGIEKPLSPGDNIIEFLPEETGSLPYSCWMGMIRSSIKVVEDLSALSESEIYTEEQQSAPAGGCSCCGG